MAEVLDHNIDYSYDYTLIVGSLKEIREYVYRCEKDRSLPRWKFTKDRQHWTYRNITDAGWPIKDGLKLNLKKGTRTRAMLMSPKTFWRAEKASTLTLQAAFKTEATSAKLLLQPYGKLAAGDWPQWGPERGADQAKRPKPAAAVVVPIKIIGDGQMRTVKVDLSAYPAYRGGMTQVRIQLPQGPGWARIRAVGFMGE